MDDDEPPPYVPVRPYSLECAAAGEQRRQPAHKVFRPTPPSERRAVEPVLLSSTPAEATAQSLLQDAWRQQELESFGVSGPTPRSTPEHFQGMSLKKFGLGVGGGIGGIATMGAQVGSGAGVPRKMKERKEGRSMELMDLAFTRSQKLVDGEIKSHYAPISLPYFQMTQDEEEEAGGGERSGGTGRKGRPQMVHVDEANANAAKELFLGEDDELLEDRIFLMQLPSVLPELADELEEVRREHEDAATAGVGASITKLPDGLVGKLRIHKSGKVRMDMGGLQFCVDQGCDTFFQQNLACVCPLAREIFDLGNINKRIVLTPDIDSMVPMDVEAPAQHPAPAEPMAAAQSAVLPGPGGKAEA